MAGFQQLSHHLLPYILFLIQELQQKNQMEMNERFNVDVGDSLKSDSNGSLPHRYNTIAIVIRPSSLLFLLFAIFVYYYILLLFIYNRNLMKTGCCFCCRRLVLFPGIKFWRQCRIDKQRSVQHWARRQF